MSTHLDSIAEKSRYVDKSVSALVVSPSPYSRRMGRRVDIDDLVDAAQVAELLGLSQPNSVYLYQAEDMPTCQGLYSIEEPIAPVCGCDPRSSAGIGAEASSRVQHVPATPLYPCGSSST